MCVQHCGGNRAKIKKAKKDGDKKEEWEIQHDIADTRSPIMRVDFENAIKDIKEEINIEELSLAINTGKTAKVLPKVKFKRKHFKSLDESVTDLVNASGSSSERFLPTVRQDLIYNPKNKSVKAWVDFYAGQRLQNMDRQTRKVVKDVLRQKKRENLTTAQTAKKLRERIGLNSVQARALDNLEKSMVKSGKTEKQIEKAKEQYTKKAIRYRSKMIANTEAIDAVNFGQLEVWQQGIEQGVIEPDLWVKEWNVTPDDKLCPICKPMDGQQRPINEKFDDPSGTFPSVYAPTIHPNCRCSMILKKKRRK